MTKLHSTLAGLTLGLTALVGGLTPAPANAAQCVHGNGYEMCFAMTDRSGSLTRWDVRLRNNHGTETMDVVCDGNTMKVWRSHGMASQSEASMLARSFCAL